jgi:hypothetical protein
MYSSTDPVRFLIAVVIAGGYRYRMLLDETCFGTLVLGYLGQIPPFLLVFFCLFLFFVSLFFFQR